MIKKKIMAIDDDDNYLFLLSEILESSCYQVICVKESKIAIEVLKNRDDIDLVIVDLNMPDIDGTGLINMKRQIPEKSKIPTIIFSADYNVGVIAKRHGLDYLDKGSTKALPDRLLLAIEENLKSVR